MDATVDRRHARVSHAGPRASPAQAAEAPSPTDRHGAFSRGVRPGPTRGTGGSSGGTEAPRLGGAGGHTHMPITGAHDRHASRLCPLLQLDGACAAARPPEPGRVVCCLEVPVAFAPPGSEAAARIPLCCRPRPPLTVAG